MSSNTEDNISISAIKASFLQTQTRLLSAPLHISATYLLSDKQLAHLQKRVSDRISQHGKAVFSSQSIGHVAEQIETLYWNQDVQLTDEEAVAGLPETLAEALFRGRKRAAARATGGAGEATQRSTATAAAVSAAARAVADVSRPKAADSAESGDDGDGQGRDEDRAGADEGVAGAGEGEEAATGSAQAEGGSSAASRRDKEFQAEAARN
ncbi:hypothetical protein DV738_g4358, partial [Chaetothyriales sp. CBS 135597]